MTTIHQANQRLQQGVEAHAGYPSSFQATDLPHLAGTGEVRLLANNHAFFFVRNSAGNPAGITPSEQIHTDTTHLKTLLRHVRDNGTRMTLQLDADVLDNPQRFVEKYHPLRPEEPETARALLAQEVQLIGDFLRSGGVRELAREVIGEGKNLPPRALDALADRFIQQQFRIQAVQTEKPLQQAVWQADTPSGTLLARQEYQPAAHATDRRWLLGNAATATHQAQQGDANAASLLDAVAQANSLPARDMPLQPARHNSVAVGR